MASHNLSGAMEINEASQDDGVATQPLRSRLDRMPNKRLLATFVLASISVSALLLALWPIFSVVVAAKVLRAIASSLLGPTLVISLRKRTAQEMKGWPIIVTGSAAPPAQTWGSQFFELRVIAVAIQPDRPYINSPTSDKQKQ